MASQSSTRKEPAGQTTSRIDVNRPGWRWITFADLGSLAALTILLAACSGSPERGEPPARTAIEVVQVGPAGAAVHQAPAPGSAVLGKYPTGEHVSVYTKKSGWSEVSFGLDSSGWIPSGDLQPLGQSSSAGIAKPSVRFLRPPAPVTNRQATGLIVLEGSVNSEGKIYDVRTIQNTTGSPELERQNRDQFSRAIFAPVIVNGQAVPFVYDYRIEY